MPQPSEPAKPKVNDPVGKGSSIRRVNIGKALTIFFFLLAAAIVVIALVTALTPLGQTSR